MIDYSIDLEGGKYTVIRYKSGKMEAKRYGEEWRDLTGDNMIGAMLNEIEGLRFDLAELNKGEGND